MQSRQSPISSRNRSTTTARSEGTAPVAASCSRRKVRRFVAARSSSLCSAWSLAFALSSSSGTSSREVAPIASPSSYGRPMPSPFQNGTAPGTPGAGETSTRSRVISSIRQVDAPSKNVWPARAAPAGRGAGKEGGPGARLVDHLLVQLADAPAAVDEMHAEQAAVGNGARVGDRQTARALSPADDAGGAIPDDPRPQLRELVRRVAARQHA